MPYTTKEKMVYPEQLHTAFSSLQARKGLSSNTLSRFANEQLMHLLIKQKLIEGKFTIEGEGAVTKYVNYIDIHDKNATIPADFHAITQKGYEAVKVFLRNNPDTSAENITLSADFFDGAIVTEIAKKLHDEGLHVNLNVDMCFSNLSTIPSTLLNLLQEYIDLKNDQDLPFLINALFNPDSIDSIIKQMIPKDIQPIVGMRTMLDQYTDPFEKYSGYLPLITSYLACGIIGLSIGLALGELIMSVGVLIASLVAGIGYNLSLGLELIGLESPASYLNVGFNAIALAINTCFDVLSCAISAVLGFALLPVGLAIGAMVGAGLSLATHITKKPVHMSFDFALQALLGTTCGNVTPKDNLEQMAKNKTSGHTKKLSFFNAGPAKALDPMLKQVKSTGFLDTGSEQILKEKSERVRDIVFDATLCPS
ncbi:MAG: hypothetical protein QNK11_00740 [Legionella sp.]|nr:hypothetical protein [Legionella sp.]